MLVDDHLPHWVLIGLELVGVGLIGVELVGVGLVGVELVGVELLNRDGARGRLARHAVNPSMGARLGNPCLARSRQPPPRSIPFTLPDSGSAGFPGFTVLVRQEMGKSCIGFLARAVEARVFVAVSGQSSQLLMHFPRYHHAWCGIQGVAQLPRIPLAQALNAAMRRVSAY